MTALQQEATIRWLGNPPAGVPRLSVGSESLRAWPIDVSRDAEHPLATSPGELLAGAIGSVFAWLAAEQLLRDGTPARELIAYTTLTVAAESDEPMDMALSAIDCQLVGRVPDLDDDRFEAAAQGAIARCVAALGMRSGAVAVSVATTLEGG